MTSVGIFSGDDFENYQSQFVDVVMDDVERTVMDSTNTGGRLEPERLSDVVQGIIDECRSANSLESVKELLSECVQARSHVSLCENTLVEILGFSRMSLVDRVVKYGVCLVYYLRLQASSDSRERSAIFREVEGLALTDGGMLPVVDFLRSSCEFSDVPAVDADGQSVKPTALVELLRGESSSMSGSSLLSHFTTNKFTAGSTLDMTGLEGRVYKDTSSKFEVVHVTPPTKDHLQADLFVAIDSLPRWARTPFGGISHLNAIQSKVFSVACSSLAHPAPTGVTEIGQASNSQSPNILLCAPTGAGKTNVASLCIVDVLARHQVGGAGANDIGEHGVRFRTDDLKVVYIAPMKALVQEVVSMLAARFGPLGLTVAELSGDSSLSSSQIRESQILVATPEKFDIVTRRTEAAGPESSQSLLAVTRLVIIDEVHILGDTRGPVIEAIVARIHKHNESYTGSLVEDATASSIVRGKPSERVRLVGLSATLPNPADVARFLHVESDKGLFVFGPEYRPVPLHQTYVGVATKQERTSTSVAKSREAETEALTEYCFKALGIGSASGTGSASGATGIPSGGDSKRNQTIVFVHSRKDTWQTALQLKEAMSIKGLLGEVVTSNSKGVLKHEAQNVTSSAHLKELLEYGIGIHHAGLAKNDRTLVEELFAAGHLALIVSTMTLAWGVNLPAHTVIIKGTEVYRPGSKESSTKGFSRLTAMDMHQIFGRSGRPQYDTSGHGVVITSAQDIGYYVSLNNYKLPLASHLLDPANLSGNGVQGLGSSAGGFGASGSSSSCCNVVDYINAEVVLGTIRSLRDAVEWVKRAYWYCRASVDSVSFEEDAGKEYVGSLPQFCVNLAHTALAQLEKLELVSYAPASGAVTSTALGKTASTFYVSVESIAAYKRGLKDRISDIEVLELLAESKEFRGLTVRQDDKAVISKLAAILPIPLRAASNSSVAKFACLVQCYVGRLPLDGLSIGSDMPAVQQSLGRVVRALFDIALSMKFLSAASTLHRWSVMVQHRMWSTDLVIRQVPSLVKDVPEEVVSRLEKRELELEELTKLKVSEVAEIVKAPKFARQISESIHSVPRLTVEAMAQPGTSNSCVIGVTVGVVPPAGPYSDKKLASQFYSRLAPLKVYVLVTSVSDDTALGLSMLRVGDYLAEGSLSFEANVSCFVPMPAPFTPLVRVACLLEGWFEECSGASTLVNLRALRFPSAPAAPRNIIGQQMGDLPTRRSLDLLGPLLKQLGVSELRGIQAQSIDSLANFLSQDRSSSLRSELLIGAQPGSQKGLLSTLAVLHAALARKGCVFYVYMGSERTADIKELRLRKSLGENGVSLQRLRCDSSEIHALPTDTSTMWFATRSEWERYFASLVFQRAYDSVSDLLSQASLVVIDGLGDMGSPQGAEDERFLTWLACETRVVVNAGKQSPKTLVLTDSLNDPKDIAEVFVVDPEYSEKTGLSPMLLNFQTKPCQIEVRGVDSQGWSNDDEVWTVMSRMAVPVLEASRALGRSVLVVVPNEAAAQVVSTSLASIGLGGSSSVAVFPGSLASPLALVEFESALVAAVQAGSSRTIVVPISDLNTLQELCEGRVDLSEVIVLDSRTPGSENFNDLHEYSATDIQKVTGMVAPGRIGRCLILRRDNSYMPSTRLASLYQLGVPLESNLDSAIQSLILTMCCGHDRASGHVFACRVSAMVALLDSSFLKKRYLSNPEFYGVDSEESVSPMLRSLLDGALDSLCSGHHPLARISSLPGGDSLLVLKESGVACLRFGLGTDTASSLASLKDSYLSEDSAVEAIMKAKEVARVLADSQWLALEKLVSGPDALENSESVDVAARIRVARFMLESDGSNGMMLGGYLQLWDSVARAMTQVVEAAESILAADGSKTSVLGALRQKIIASRLRRE